MYFDHSGTEQLGQELEYLGFAIIAEDAGPGLKRMLINNSSREIQVGDRLLVKVESSIGSTIFPSEPEAPVSGMIVAFLGHRPSPRSWIPSSSIWDWRISWKLVISCQYSSRALES